MFDLYEFGLIIFIIGLLSIIIGLFMIISQEKVCEKINID